MNNQSIPQARVIVTTSSGNLSATLSARTPMDDRTDADAYPIFKFIGMHNQQVMSIRIGII